MFLTCFLAEKLIAPESEFQQTLQKNVAVLPFYVQLNQKKMKKVITYTMNV